MSNVNLSVDASDDKCVVDAEQESLFVVDDERGTTAAVYNPKRHLPLHEQRQRLRIRSYYREFLWAVQVSRVVIVVGDTGTGKSTQLPQYLRENGWDSDDRLILISVPMRIGAISLATRVAQESNCELGTEVGYITAEQSLYSPSCHIRYITDRILLQLIQSDPLLLQVGVIILDDCHQRRSEGDLLVALIKKIHAKRPYLRLIMLSATMDTEIFIRFFSSDSHAATLPTAHAQYAEDHQPKCRHTYKNAASTAVMCNTKNKHPEELLDVTVVHVAGRLYPIDIQYLQDPCTDYIEAAYEAVMHIHRTTKDYDAILVFLCGKEDVELLIERITRAKQYEEGVSGHLSTLTVCPLYGSLPLGVQLQAFRAVGHRERKVIVSTNIAESAVTIEGVGYVVDSGFVKISQYDRMTNMEILSLVPISKASAHQRAGRAGRTHPGQCYRLYTEPFFETHLLNHTIPELMRVDLSHTVLYLLSLGIDNFITQFDLPLPISSDALLSAFNKLHALQAVNDLGQLTEDYGMRMAELLPLDPLLSRFVVYSTKAPVICSYEATVIASMMMCGSPWVTPNSKSRLKQKLLEACMRSIGVREGDLVTLYNVYKEAEFHRADDSQWESRHMVNTKVLKRAEQLQKRLKHKLESWGATLESVGDDVTSLQKAICAAFFLNAAYRRGDGKYALCALKRTHTDAKHSSSPLIIHPLSLTNPHQPPFVVFYRGIVVGGIDREQEAQMIHVTPIDPTWLQEVAGHYFHVEHSGHHHD